MIQLAMQFNREDEKKKRGGGGGGKRRRKIRHIRNNEKDDERIHDQGKRDVNIIDVGSTGVRIEDPLQHDGARQRELSERSDSIQRQKIRYEGVARRDARIDSEVQENFDKRVDEGERERRGEE